MGQSLEPLIGSYLLFRDATTYRYVPFQMRRYEILYKCRAVLNIIRVRLFMHFMGFISLAWAGVFLWKRFPNYIVRTSLIGIAGYAGYVSKPFIQEELKDYQEVSCVLSIMKKVDEDCRFVENRK